MIKNICVVCGERENCCHHDVLYPLELILDIFNDIENYKSFLKEDICIDTQKYNNLSLLYGKVFYKVGEADNIIAKYKDKKYQITKWIDIALLNKGVEFYVNDQLFSIKSLEKMNSTTCENVNSISDINTFTMNTLDDKNYCKVLNKRLLVDNVIQEIVKYTEENGTKDEDKIIDDLFNYLQNAGDTTFSTEYKLAKQKYEGKKLSCDTILIVLLSYFPNKYKIPFISNKEYKWYLEHKTFDEIYNYCVNAVDNIYPETRCKKIIIELFATKASFLPTYNFLDVILRNIYKITPLDTNGKKDKRYEKINTLLQDLRR